MAMYLLRNTVRDCEFDHKRETGKTCRAPVVGKQRLPAGAVRRLMEVELTAEFLLELKPHQDVGNLQLLQLGPGGGEVDIGARLIDMGAIPLPPAPTKSTEEWKELLGYTFPAPEVVEVRGQMEDMVVIDEVNFMEENEAQLEDVEAPGEGLKDAHIVVEEEVVFEDFGGAEPTSSEELVRARHEDGTFVADDPETPENEAFVPAEEPENEGPATVEDLIGPTEEEDVGVGGYTEEELFKMRVIDLRSLLLERFKIAKTAGKAKKDLVALVIEQQKAESDA